MEAQSQRPNSTNLNTGPSETCTNRMLCWYPLRFGPGSLYFFLLVLLSRAVSVDVGRIRV